MMDRDSSRPPRAKREPNMSGGIKPNPADEKNAGKELGVDQAMLQTGIYEISREIAQSKPADIDDVTEAPAELKEEAPEQSAYVELTDDGQPTGIFEKSQDSGEWKPLEITRKPAEAKKEDSIEFLPEIKDNRREAKPGNPRRENRAPKTIISPEKGIDFEYSYVDDVQNFEKAPITQTEAPRDIQPREKQPREKAVKEAEEAETAPGRQRKGGGARGVVSGVSKALIYLIVVVIVSVVAAIAIIRIGNDVFAFVKRSDEVTVTIKEYATTEEVAKLLYAHNVIEYPTVFRIFARLKKDDGKYIAGEYTITPSMNYDELLDAFKAKVAKREEIRLTIPEGYTVDDIIKLFTSNGMGTKEGFVEVIQNYEFDYWFVEELNNLSPDRKYRLEGYLYPDTYDFYKDWSEETIINKLLANFDKKFIKEYRESCTLLGVTVDEVVNLASIIQMEAKYTDEYGAVSSVLHNRLDSAYFNRRLDCDATIQYSFEERKTRLEEGDTAIDTPYNTYIYGGLPPGPITNPIMSAIDAALYPDDTNYYYFVSQSNGRLLYATTYEQHQANIRSIR